VVEGLLKDGELAVALQTKEDQLAGLIRRHGLADTFDGVPSRELGRGGNLKPGFIRGGCEASGIVPVNSSLGPPVVSMLGDFSDMYFT
jgi:hypothetical protein